MRIGFEADVARLAGDLLSACESGDPSRLHSAVRQAVDQMQGPPPQSSALKGELRDLLLGITYNLDQILNGHSLDSRQKVQMKVCYDLLRHARGAAMSANHG